MNKKTSSSGGGIGCTTVLFLIFLVLKLTHLINWSWWWVTAPLWIPLAIVLGVYLIGLAIVAVRELTRV